MTRDEVIRLYLVAKQRNKNLEYQKMKTIKIASGHDIPENFTGIVEFPNGTKKWFKEGKRHRLDGPAIEWADGDKWWYLNGISYFEEEWKLKVQELKAPKMETIKVRFWTDIPRNFTGVAGFPDGTKAWYKEGKYHREDGPTIEHADGSKEWHKEGKYHREDGPAVELADGTKKWHKEGKLHRLDGPAAEWANGTKKWLKEGNLHREDGPAIEWSNGKKEWYKEGFLHREDGPAIEEKNGIKYWYKEGKCHREDAPAVEYSDGSKEWWINHSRYSEEEWKLKVQKLRASKMETIKVTFGYEIPKNFTGIAEFPNGSKHWYKDGKRHREDGPALEWDSGKKEWYKEGNHHREDGPAIEYSDGTKKWYKEGNLHREDGPAIIWVDGTKHWYKDGKRHREDGPAIEDSGGTKRWYKEGQLHREDGPACEYSSGHKEWWIKGKRVSKVENIPIEIIKVKNSYEIPKNFTGIIEWPNGNRFWYKEGKVHREDGPAVECPDGSKEWFKEGNLHRLDGPAIEWSNRKKEWYKEGKLHREDGPAIEWVDGTKHWYKNGLLHREGGPAVEYTGGTKFWYKEGRYHREDGPALEYSGGHKEWWIKGKRVSKVEKIPIESKLNAQKTKPSKSRQVAIRIASRQVIKSISALITKTLTKGFKASDSQKLNSWFKSEAGSAVLMVLVGKILPRFEAVLPEEYKPLFSEIAEEIEIETMVDLTDGIIDSVAAAMVSFDFNSFQFFNDESEAVENVRVETLSAPTVTPWESHSEALAEQSAIKFASG